MKFIYFIFLLLIMTASQGQIINTIAGNGTVGYSGDGGPATSAQIGDIYIISVAIDNAGNYYIPQDNQNRIRMVNSAGIINTIAGTGAIGYSGDGGPAIAAKLYHPSASLADN